MNIKKFTVIALYTLIFALAIIPPCEGQASIPYLDKLIHFLAFFILSVGTLYAFRVTQIFQCILFIVCYGIFIEVIQYFIPYRSFEILDIIADIIGALVGFKALKKI